MTVETTAPTLQKLTSNPLSDREMDVAELLATGASNSEIARDLTISPQTVKVHVRNIFDKLQVNSRTEASMLLIQRGWLTVPGIELPTGQETTAEAPLEPLDDTRVEPLLWQRIYLVTALAICLLVLIAPNLLSKSGPTLDLLSDATQTTVGTPILETLPRWEPRTPMSQPRSRLATAKVGDQIYLIGGETVDGETVSTVEVYDLQVNDWRVATPLPEALANAGAAVVNERIYLAGGSFVEKTPESNRSVTSNAFLEYDPATETWTRLLDLPHPLAGASLVSVGDSLYLIGGWDGSIMRDEIWRIVPPTEAGEEWPNWELVTRLDVPRAFFGALHFKDGIYIIGGYDGQNELALSDLYRVESDEWETLPLMSTPRSGLSLVSDGIAIFALGGGWKTPIETHERFRPDAKLWSNFPSPIVGEWRHFAAAGDEGNLYLMGGWSGGYLNTNLRYSSSMVRLFVPIIQSD